MTDHRRDEVSRLDLRSLDVVPDDVGVEAIVGAVMQRVQSDVVDRARHAADLNALKRARVYLVAAAAVLAAIAAATVLASARSADNPGSGIDLIARWAEASHVPTNGELLVVYQGYKP